MQGVIQHGRISNALWKRGERKKLCTVWFCVNEMLGKKKQTIVTGSISSEAAGGGAGNNCKVAQGALWGG